MSNGKRTGGNGRWMGGLALGQKLLDGQPPGFGPCRPQGVRLKLRSIFFQSALNAFLGHSAHEGHQFALQRAMIGSGTLAQPFDHEFPARS